MAAPVIATKSVNVSSINAVTNVVGAPAWIVDGDLLLYFLVLDGTATSIIVPTGFTEISVTIGFCEPHETRVNKKIIIIRNVKRLWNWVIMFFMIAP